MFLSLNLSSKVGNSDTILIYAPLLMNKTTQSGKFSQSQYLDKWCFYNLDRIESGFRHVDSIKQDTLIVHFKKLWNEEYERYTYEAMSPLDPRHLCCDDGFLVIFSGEDRIIQVTFY